MIVPIACFYDWKKQKDSQADPNQNEFSISKFCLTDFNFKVSRNFELLTWNLVKILKKKSLYPWENFFSGGVVHAKPLFEPSETIEAYLKCECMYK